MIQVILMMSFLGTPPNEYGINRSKLLNSFEDYIVAGQAINGVSDITANALERARISKCRRTKTRHCRSYCCLGWNFVSRS